MNKCHPLPRPVCLPALLHHILPHSSPPSMPDEDCVSKALSGFGWGDHCPWAPGGLSTPIPGGTWSLSCYLKDCIGIEGSPELRLEAWQPLDD